VTTSNVYMQVVVWDEPEEDGTGTGRRSEDKIGFDSPSQLTESDVVS